MPCKLHRLYTVEHTAPVFQWGFAVSHSLEGTGNFLFGQLCTHNLQQTGRHFWSLFTHRRTNIHSMNLSCQLLKAHALARHRVRIFYQQMA